MTLEPWIIEHLEEERRRREKEEAERTHVELPQTAPVERESEKAGPGGRVLIVDISPPDDHVISV